MMGYNTNNAEPKLHPYIRLYIKACLTLVVLIIMCGFVAPAMISSDDSFLVVMGFCLLLAVPPIAGTFAWHAYKQLQPPLKGKSK